MIGIVVRFLGVLHNSVQKNMKIHFHFSTCHIYLPVKCVRSECYKNQKDIWSIDEVIGSLVIPIFFDHTLSSPLSADVRERERERERETRERERNT